MSEREQFLTRTTAQQLFDALYSAFSSPMCQHGRAVGRHVFKHTWDGHVYGSNSLASGLMLGPGEGQSIRQVTKTMDCPGDSTSIDHQFGNRLFPVPGPPYIICCVTSFLIIPERVEIPKKNVPPIHHSFLACALCAPIVHRLSRDPAGCRGVGRIWRPCTPSGCRSLAFKLNAV